MTFPQMERYLRDKTTGEASVVGRGVGGEAKKWLKSCDTREAKEKGLHHHHHRDDGDDKCGVCGPGRAALDREFSQRASTLSYPVVGHIFGPGQSQLSLFKRETLSF